MNQKLRILFVLILFFTTVTNFKLLAQDSMLPEVSPMYLDKLIATAKMNYPRIKTLQHRIEAARHNVTKTKFGWFDMLTVSYVYQPGNNTFDVANPEKTYFNGFQAGVFLNIGNLLQKPSLIRQAKQEQFANETEKEEYLLNITMEVKKRYYFYVQRGVELKIQTKLSQDAETAVKDVRHRFEKGEENYDNYNKAQMTYSQNLVTKVLAESNLLVAKAELEELLGQNLESIK